MKFDRRKFFQSIAASAGALSLPTTTAAEVSRGTVLAEDVRADVPVLPDTRVPFMLPRICDRRPCLWFDTFVGRKGEAAPACVYLFQIPIGQYDMHGKMRTRLDTNMLAAGAFPGGVDAVAERIGFLFHPDTSDEDMLAASGTGYYEFIVAHKIRDRGSLDWAATGSARGNPLAREAKFIDIARTFIPMYMYFNVRLEFYEPVVWKNDVRLLCFLDTLTGYPVQ